MKKLVKEKRSMRLSQEEMKKVAEIVGLDFILITIPPVRVGVTPVGINTTISEEERDKVILGSGIEIMKRWKKEGEKRRKKEKKK